jgi:hypothetical protein
VFGIAIGKVWSEVEGSLANLQGENISTGESVVGGSTIGTVNDELSDRRKRKLA